MSASAHQNIHPPKGALASERSETIAVSIVEDDDWFRENLAREIDSTPSFRCISHYRTAEEALKSLPRDKPDVVLMDINLQGKDGIACVKALKDSLPDINVLMLTVYEESERIFDSLRAGASGYLLKRSTPEELNDAIRNVQSGGSPMTSLIARKVVHYFKNLGPTPSEINILAPREKEILDRLGEGMAYKEIADVLGLKIDTVRTYVRGVYRKLHVHSRGEAVAKYLRR
jgi:DNA-binding NarL/FixJ family response regulator